MAPDLMKDGKHPPGWNLDARLSAGEQRSRRLRRRDVRHGSIKRVASALARAIAVQFIHRYMAKV